MGPFSGRVRDTLSLPQQKYVYKKKIRKKNGLRPANRFDTRFFSRHSFEVDACNLCTQKSIFFFFLRSPLRCVVHVCQRNYSIVQFKTNIFFRLIVCVISFIRFLHNFNHRIVNDSKWHRNCCDYDLFLFIFNVL